MYHSSTQKKHWTFQDVEELNAIRKQNNQRFCQQHQGPDTPLLSASEELELFRYYQKKLVELCNLFAPPKWLPLPRSALVSVEELSFECHVVGGVIGFCCVHRRQLWRTSNASTCTPL